MNILIFRIMIRVFRFGLISACAFFLQAEQALWSQNLQDAIALEYTNPDSAILVAKNLVDSNASDSLLISNAMEVIGISYWVKGNLKDAFHWHNRSLELRKQVHFTAGIAHSNNNLGLVYWKLGNHQKALEHYHEALNIAESMVDSVIISNVLGNIGILYKEQRDLERALQFYEQSLNILKKRKNSRDLANMLNNAAIIYRELGNSEKARTYWMQCLNLYSQHKDNRGQALIFNNLGLIYSDQNQFLKADSLFTVSLDTYRHLNDLSGLSMVLGNLGTNAKSRGEYSKAIELCNESLVLAEETGSTDFLKSACKCLADAYDLSGNHREASVYLWRYINLSDSLEFVKSNEQVALIQERYEHEKELVKSAIERERQRALAEAEIHRQLLVRNASIIIGLLAIALLWILFIGYRKKLRANVLLQSRNAEIFRQRQEIANKSREVTESITYAKRLQDARLPGPELFSRYFSSWHVLFRPKDIVSGDFYWLEFVDGCVYIAVADCTGHGVPGAMVSMIGIQALNDALLNKRLRDPAQILNDVNRYIASSFVKSGNTMTDGMDIALTRINAEQGTLCFAGAYNPLWIISNKPQLPGAELKLEVAGKCLYEIKADRQSLGDISEERSFVTRSVNISRDEILVLFSDGYADQFGGPLNKKYGSRKLRNLLVTVAENQNWSMIDKTFNDWKGSNLQEDDVTLLVASLL